MALLEVRGIDVAYGAVTALRQVTLEVNEGERVALIGANGAGKTTTLRAISGLLAPTKGEIFFDGQPIQGLPAHVVVGRGVVHAPEGRALFSGMTVEENLRFGFLARPIGSSYEDRLAHVYEQFPKLKERRAQAAGTMSGGEQQMLVVGRALMADPRLLMVDELSLGLAPKIVAQLFDILEAAHESGTAILIVEQFVDLALQHTDRAYLLAKGSVAMTDTSKAMRASDALAQSYLGTS